MYKNYLKTMILIRMLYDIMYKIHRTQCIKKYKIMNNNVL